MIRVDLLVTGLAQVATLSLGPTPRTGEAMAELGLIENAAVGVDRGRFVFVGKARQAMHEVRVRSTGHTLDAGRRVALPGFVDAHTHLLFAGDRSGEVALKIRGKTYREIAEGGGGLYSTVRATRAARANGLRRAALDRLRRIVAWGTTSVEVKSGYALDHAGELRLLGLVPRLVRDSGMQLTATYLGAHAVPPEFVGRADDYVEEIVRRTLPEVARRGLARFCDVFCEPGFFSVEQASRILRAALSLGLGVKVHAEEFEWSGGAQLASQLRARSAEHLLRATTEDRSSLASARVTAVLLPVTPFASMSATRALGREMVDAGVPVALGSDLSPNSWVEGMPIVLAHAVYGGRLTPEEAITAATLNAAHASGLADSAGTIAVGRPADFALYDVPSVEHIPYRIGVHPSVVYRQGNPISSR